MPTNQCPQAEELSGLVFGTLDPELAGQVADHLETCTLCEETVQQLESESDGIIGQIRTTPTADSFEAEAGCQQALAKIEAIGRDPSFNMPERHLQAEDEQAELGVYRLLEELGKGGMGTVYRALHTRLEKVVALKILATERLKDPHAVSRFDREMKAVGKLDHAHIVRAFDAGEADGQHFLVTEYVEGADLSQLSRKLGPLPIADACELARQAALGLEEAHEHGMVHRDIKPANLFLARQKGRPPMVKVLDLGLALIAGEHAPTDELTGTGQIMGTIDYMAPEQAGDTHNVDIRADIYSLGATLYRLLTGSSIYRSDKQQSVMQKLSALANQAAPPIQSRRAEVPDELTAVVQRMLEKDPAGRYATPAEVVSALEPFCAGHDLKALLQPVEAEQTVVDTAAANSASVHDGSVETQDAVDPGLLPTVVRTADRVAVAETVVRPRSAGRGWTRWVLGAAAVAAMLLGVILIQTQDGTIRIETNQTDVEVLIDDEKTVYIVDPNDKTTIIVEIPKGAKTLRVRKAGFVTKTEEFALETVKGLVKVSFVPVKRPGVGAGVDGKLPAAGGAPSWKAMPAQRAFLERVAMLPAEEQVEAVRAKLREVNPGFDGEATYRIEEGVVLEFSFVSDEVTEIWPVRGLTKLAHLSCRGSGLGKGKLADLSPLEGLPLTYLNCGFTRVTDLTPLVGMPLSRLMIGKTPVADLKALVGMKLRILQCESTQISDLSPLQGMPIVHLDCGASDVSDLSPLKGMPLTKLGFGYTQVADLSPLRGMKLNELRFPHAQVSDLSPLRGLPLTLLQFNGSLVTDLSPLQGLVLTKLAFDVRLYHSIDEKLLKSLPLKSIWVERESRDIPIAEFWQRISARRQAAEEFAKSVVQLPVDKQIEAVRNRFKELEPNRPATVGTTVTDSRVTEATLVYHGRKSVNHSQDLTPLMAFTDLKKLTITGGVDWLDLSALQFLPLESLVCPDLIVRRNSPILADMKTLKTINGKPATEYWEELQGKMRPVAKPQAGGWRPTESQRAFLDRVAKLPAGEQVEVVRAKLREVNPGFDGEATHKIEEGVVVEFSFVSDAVTEIWPVRALAGLQVLNCAGSSGGKGKLSDLSPLAGMPLENLRISYTRVANLRPLRGMPLKVLSFARTNISDLTPLQGMALERVSCPNSRANDVSPLRGQPLKMLGFGATRVTDLTPLRGMDIPEVSFPFIHVADFSALNTMKLKDVNLHVPLFDIEAQRIIDPLKIETVNGQHPSVFLAELETRRKSALEFANGTSILPPHQQLRHVRAKLQEFCTDGYIRLGSVLKNRVVTEVALTSVGEARPDVSPLMAFKGLRTLTYSDMNNKAYWPDLSALKFVPLEELKCRHEIAFANSGVLKQMTTLKKVNGQPVAEYWQQIQEHLKDREAQAAPGTKPWNASPVQQAFFDELANLAPEKQLGAVRRKLEEINPGFDGKLSHALSSHNEVVRLTFNTDRVTQIWPVRAFRSLETLHCSGSRSEDPNRGKGVLSDLSPLTGMQLIDLNISLTQVVDLSPLTGMPLRSLTCAKSPLSSLLPLRGMAIESLVCSHSDVSDLSPLRGMPLHTLLCGATQVSDISPIRELPLTSLSCRYSHVADISPVTSLTSMGPFFYFDVPLFDDSRLDFVRSLKNEKISELDKAEFLEEYAARRKAATDFATATATLSPKDQLAAVAAKLPLAPKAIIKNGEVVEVLLGLTHHTLDASPLMAFTKMKKLTLVGKPYWPDLSGLKHVPIEELNCPGAIAFQNSGVLKTIATLKTINGKPAAEYWEGLPGRMKNGTKPRADMPTTKR